jgi:uncharacterized OsmC-like protein
MESKVRPKRFGPVFVRFDGAGGVTFATDANGPGQPYPPSDKPVLTLMASVGHCLVESIRIVAGRDETKVDAFAISVSAERSLDAPGRLQTLSVRVHGKIVEDQALAQDLVKQAKSICTVSNTLNSEITVELVLADQA